MGQTKTRAKRPFQNYVSWKYHPNVGNNVMKTNFTICLREICDLLNVMKTNFTICLREICDLLNVLQAPLQTGKVSIRNKIHQQI